MSLARRGTVRRLGSWAALAVAAGWTALAAVPLSGAPESGAPESGALAQLKIPGPPPVRPQPPEVRPEFRIGLLLAGGPYAASSDDIAAGLAPGPAGAGGGGPRGPPRGLAGRGGGCPRRARPAPPAPRAPGSPAA